MLDVAPTVYQVHGEPAPAGLDGRVASEILLPDYREVAVASEPALEAVTTSPEGYGSVEESEEIRRRLRDLGYLD